MRNFARSAGRARRTDGRTSAELLPDIRLRCCLSPVPQACGKASIGRFPSGAPLQSCGRDSGRCEANEVRLYVRERANVAVGSIKQAYIAFLDRKRLMEGKRVDD